MDIVERAGRPERRRLQKLIHRSREVEEVRRATAVLNLLCGATPSEAAARVGAARSSIYRWAAWYREQGLAGLRSAPRGRPERTVSSALIDAVCGLLQQVPHDFGFLRSTWSSELLSRVLAVRYALTVHASTLRRLLPKLGWRWRRARPTLNKRDPRKAERLAAIEQALAEQEPYTEVFYVDEVDVDLNPRIGCQWQPRGVQHAVVTPGQNRKHYVAGALHAHTGQLVWVMHERKNALLFLDLLRRLRRQYRRARRIVLILDNYLVYRCKVVQRWLRGNPKFELRFQPV